MAQTGMPSGPLMWRWDVAVDDALIPVVSDNYLFVLPQQPSAWW